MRRIKGLLTAICITSLCVLAGCKSIEEPGHPPISVIDKELTKYIKNNRHRITLEQQRRANFVRKALIPPLRPYDYKDAKAARFNISVKDVNAQSFFQGLVEGTPYSITVSPKISGTITLDLKDVSVERVLIAVESLYGYAFKRTAHGFQVMPNGLQTEMFQINYLALERTGKSHMLINSGGLGKQSAHYAKKVKNPYGTASGSGSSSGGTNADGTPSSTSVATTTEANFWKGMAETIRTIIGDEKDRKITLNKHAGIIMVRAMPKELDQVRHYVDTLQTSINRQVIIEAKILEVTLNKKFQTGINWHLLGIQQDLNQGFLNATPSNATLNGLFSITSKAKDFTSVIKLLSTQGNLQVLSSPHIATLNNQKAVIKVGDDQYYITGITNTTVTGTATQNTQEVDLDVFFSGVALSVTPQISPDNSVILHIHPVISVIQENSISYTIGDSGNTQSIPSAKNSVRESDSIVRAQDGQVVVIGGLMQNITNEELSSTPWLSKIPFLGSAFRSTYQEGRKSELVILLKPVVVKPHTWANRISDSEQHIKSLNRGYHFGTHTLVFGNRGEFEYTE